MLSFLDQSYTYGVAIHCLYAFDAEAGGARDVGNGRIFRPDRLPSAEAIGRRASERRIQHRAPQRGTFESEAVEYDSNSRVEP